ncbi:type II toxin-antitoxin system HipA family toxin [Enterovirga aerilata]|uniref:HipA domain-containing protein n=1 Tax=Enterovirga aerilata TaxID=2730920 RepID=A0A849ICZ1_9HYPH|nr:HipA domain-containing protein [Enterovirga sp. DB1703]NNM73857.1 HipA domain-containing protein [Enterovirga sp. DB1703]
MTSSGCFVYITLPDTVEPVVAGRFERMTARSGSTLGRFIYGRSYLARPNKVPIDTQRLAVLDDVVKEIAGASAIFPSLRDAAPDRWGRLVIEREFGGELDEMGYLLNSPDDRAGALGFGLNPVPPAPLRDFNRTLRLPELLDAADALLRGDPIKDTPLNRQVQKLHLLGTSMGGARPKTVVEDDEGLWLAKFSRPDDAWDNPRVEHAMLELARECGISASQSKVVEVGNRPVLFVKRFDRERADNGYLRHRMISGVTFLDASETSADRTRWSYPLFADEIRRRDLNEESSRRELFRRVIFNALISNVDDHPRNHAVLGDGRGWRLAPAYDLVPTPMVAQDGRTLAMEVGAQGRLATRDNLLSECGRFAMAQEEASDLINHLRDIVETRWYGTCRAAGVSPADCESIRSAFVYPGFQWSDEPEPGNITRR